MNKLQYLRGSLVAIVTPFNENGMIDFDAYEKLIGLQLKKGTNGIVVAGTTGESAALTEDEYASLIRFTVKKVNGEVPVIAGAGSNVTTKAIRHSSIALQEGADALLILNPYYNKPTEEGIFQYYKSIAGSVDLPIIMYNVPGRTGTNMRASLTLRIAREVRNIIGIKEASGDMNQVLQILANRPEGFKVFSGDDALTLAIIANGGDGCISVVANQVPGEFSRLVNAALEGDFKAAQHIQLRLFNLMNLNFIESNPTPVKTSLYLMGYIQNQFRAPILPMTDPENLLALRSELEKLGLISVAHKNIENLV